MVKHPSTLPPHGLGRAVLALFLSAALLGHEPPPTSSAAQNSPQPESYIGRSLIDVEKELGQPVNGPSKLANGREVYVFQDDPARDRVVAEHRSAEYVAGWTMVVDNQKIVAANPIYGQYQPGARKPTATPKLIMELAVAATSEKPRAIKVTMTGTDYYLVPDEPVCVAEIESAGVRWAGAANGKLIVNVVLAKSGVDPLRKFSAAAQGQKVMMAINSLPLVVTDFRFLLTNGEVQVQVPASPELVGALKKLGLEPQP